MTDQEVTTETEAPEAEEQTTTETPTLSPEARDKELERARKEAAKYRTKLREKEEAEKAAQEAKRQAELTAEQRAAEAEAKAAKALEEAEVRVRDAKREAKLAGNVSNPERVMRLMDNAEEFFDGVEPNVAAILEAFPEYAVRQETGVNIPGARSSGKQKFTHEDISRMTEAQINENWPEIKAFLKANPR